MIILYTVSLAIVVGDLLQNIRKVKRVSDENRRGVAYGNVGAVYSTGYVSARQSLVINPIRMYRRRRRGRLSTPLRYCFATRLKKSVTSLSQ